MKTKKIKNNWVTVEQFKNEFIEFKNYVTKTLDWLVGAFKKFDEEYTIATEC